MILKVLPNGLRYPLVGGPRARHFVGTNLKPHKLPENAANPTSRVHAVLASEYAEVDIAPKDLHTLLVVFLHSWILTFHLLFTQVVNLPL